MDQTYRKADKDFLERLELYSNANKDDDSENSIFDLGLSGSRAVELMVKTEEELLQSDESWYDVVRFGDAPAFLHHVAKHPNARFQVACNEATDDHTLRMICERMRDEIGEEEWNDPYQSRDRTVRKILLHKNLSIESRELIPKHVRDDVYEAYTFLPDGSLDRSAWI